MATQKPPHTSVIVVIYATLVLLIMGTVAGAAAHYMNTIFSPRIKQLRKDVDKLEVKLEHITLLFTQHRIEDARDKKGRQ